MRCCSPRWWSRRSGRPLLAASRASRARSPAVVVDEIFLVPRTAGEGGSGDAPRRAVRDPSAGAGGLRLRPNAGDRELCGGAGWARGRVALPPLHRGLNLRRPTYTHSRVVSTPIRRQRGRPRRRSATTLRRIETVPPMIV